MLSENDPALLTATKLMGINATEFRKWIVRKQIVTRSEKIVTNLTPAQAHVVKDSVAKYVYANLFDWLVGVINDSLSCPEADKVATFIGVLDIYGFEHFKKNSFEQFCINYANEKLQQQVRLHTARLHTTYSNLLCYIVQSTRFQTGTRRICSRKDQLEFH